MVTEAEKEMAIKQQLGRLVAQKVNAYASIQEAAVDGSVSLMMLKNIMTNQYDAYSVQQLVYAAEAFGIEVHVMEEGDEVVQHS